MSFLCQVSRDAVGRRNTEIRTVDAVLTEAEVVLGTSDFKPAAQGGFLSALHLSTASLPLSQPCTAQG